MAALSLIGSGSAETFQDNEQSNAKTVQAEKVEIGISTQVLSKYVFRGITYSETPVVQQNVSVSYKGLTITGFGNLDTERGEMTEADLMLEYAHSVGDKLKLTLGYGFYTFPNTIVKKEPSKEEAALKSASGLLSALNAMYDPNYKPPEEKAAEPKTGKATIKTQEVYASVSIETLLKPTLMLAYDFDKGRGVYTEFSLSHEFHLGSADLSTRAAVAYNDHYFRERCGLSHAELDVDIPIKVGKNSYLTPTARFSKALDSDFQDELCIGIGFKTNF